MRLLLLAAATSLAAGAAASETATIIAPVVAPGSDWRGSFELKQSMQNVRIRYSATHCLNGRGMGRAILGLNERDGKYMNVWMAVQNGRGGVVEAQSETPPFELPAGRYTITLEGKVDNGRPVSVALCVGQGAACEPFKKVEPRC
jgi:hypothetical protein